MRIGSRTLEAVQALFRTVGLRIGFDHPVRNASKLFVLKARQAGIETVLDIGANKGQFGQSLRRQGYRETVVSFEPLETAHAILCTAARRDPRWIIAPAMALGVYDGWGEINIAINLASSSLLSVTERSVRAAEVSGFVGVQPVQIRRLDAVMLPEWKGPYGMKLDTQGTELQVLKGAPETLARTRLIIAEMSLTELYGGGTKLVDLYAFLEKNGFRCISLIPGFCDNDRQELLQVDGIFVSEPYRADSSTGR
jgi:FkbM family methyltransferase